MITDLILNVLSLPFTWLLDQVPGFSWPAWFSASGAGSMGSYASSIGGNVGALANWIPVANLLLILTLVLLAWGFSLVVQGLRFVVSLFTGGGGTL